MTAARLGDGSPNVARDVDPDVVVVGSGAAGLAAAIFAAERGRRVVLLEKNQRPGLKILISGGGRCNLTTTLTGAELERQYGTRRGRFLRHALRAFPPSELCRWIESEGVALREEDLQKIFPVSGRAADVLDALLRKAARAGVAIHYGSPMRGLQSTANGFAVTTDAGTLRCRRVVVATGGLSYPKTGATGDGYPVAQQLGHTLVPMVPALAPLSVETPWVRALQGIVVDAEVSVRDSHGVVVTRRRRPTLFTHRGLSGPGPMDLAGDVEERHGGCTVAIDFAPDLTADDVDAGLARGAVRAGARLALHALPLHLPERLRQTLAELAGAESVVAAALTRDQRRRLTSLVKGAVVPCDQSLGFAHAEVTRGGVVLDEIDARTMASKCAPGVHFVGEILDVDGPIGGFNFQAAFATGRLAGLAV